jgi:hypothetical protein
VWLEVVVAALVAVAPTAAVIPIPAVIPTAAVAAKTDLDILGYNIRRPIFDVCHGAVWAAVAGVDRTVYMVRVGRARSSSVG